MAKLLSYGGGLNSCAIVVEFVKRGIRPEWILFADTGGEKPATYDHLLVVNTFLRRHAFPEITTVRAVNKAQTPITLEGKCLELEVLPALAYGWKTCSQRFKAEPQEKYMNNEPTARAEWAAGQKITKVIGYDMGEDRRAKPYSDKKYEVWYPLREWGYYRADCERIVREAGLPIPPKSSCFFGPASTKRDIDTLAKENPDLLRRALELEAQAIASAKWSGSLKGLGRKLNWADYVAGTTNTSCDIDMPCGCMDVSEEED